MSDDERDIRAMLEQEAKHAPQPTGLRQQTLRRGTRRRLTGVLLPVFVVVAVSWVATGFLSADSRDPEIVGLRPSETRDSGPLYEEVPEQTQAEIFAFRALANNDLMDPYGARSYNWTYEEDTTQTDEGWRVGFAASDCEPKGNSHTCTGLSGEDPELGNAITDTLLTVRLADGQWEVLAVEGNMLPEERDRLVGYSRQQQREPSHWDFASVGLWGDYQTPSMTPIWVGPYPTEARGSVCTVRGIDAEGEPVGQPSVFYQEAPNRPFERGGWLRSGGNSVPRKAVDAVVECEQYTGPGWEIEGEPDLVGDPGEVTGVGVQVKWVGDERFTGGYECHATLIDDEGEVVWEKTATGLGIMSPNPKQYPYRTASFLSAREPIDAQEVGEVNCRTL